MSENPRVYPFKRKDELLNSNNIKQKTAFPSAGDSISLGKTTAPTKPIFRPESLLFLNMSFPDVALLLVGFALGAAQILGGLYPFGVAFAAAAAVRCRRLCGLYTIAVCIGCIAALGNNAFPYILAAVILTGIIYFKRQDEKAAWLIVPGLAVAISCCSQVIYRLMLGSVLPYDLTIIFFEGFFTAILTVVLMVVLELANEYKSITRLSTDELVCIFIMLLGCISGLGDLSIAGIKIADIAGKLLIMLAALWGGAGAGAGIGVLMGIIPSLSTLASPTTVGLYAFAGLLAGSLNNFKRMGAAAGFMLGNIILSLYLIDVSRITPELVSSTLAVILLFLVPSKLVKTGYRLFSTVALKTTQDERNQRLLRLTARRLQTTAAIFQDLSASCRTPKHELKDSTEENINMVLNHLCTQVCSKCTIQQLCWSIDFDETYRGVMALFNITEKNGMAVVQDAPENFEKRCPHIRELVATINCLYELYCQNNYWQAQRAGSRLFLAGQLAGTAQVLDNLAQDISGSEQNETYIEKTIGKNLHKLGLPIEGIQITNLGDKSLDLWLKFQSCPGENTCRQVIEKETSKAMQDGYAIADLSCAGNCAESCHYHLLKAGAKRIRIGRAQLAKAGTGVCGDSGSEMMLSEGKQLLMISDGMGAGAAAALKSGEAIKILSRLLEIGFDKNTAIDIVNTILMLQNGEEAFVTLDMCFIDLYASKAEFIKTGAAPSFIKHGGKVSIVKSNSLPVGMLQNVEKTTSTEHLLNGDMIILASDGLLDADSAIDIPWLANLLAESRITDPQEMAEFLLGKAVTISGGRLRDDITILVATVNAA